MTTHVRTIAATVTLSLLLTALAVHAQSNGLRARIPFAFTAGTAAFPSGIYTVQRLDSAQSVLMVRTLNKGAMVMSQRGHGSGAQGQPRFVFRRYGGRYFLREVWFTDAGGYGLPETGQEREAASKATKMALLSTTVTIDAAVDSRPSSARAITSED
jgi:hypothetical protein